MSALSFKGAGNRLFNASDFAGAIDQYSQAIEAARAAPGGADSAFLSRLLSNRALCHLKLSAAAAAESDADLALSLDPSNAKALRHRGIARKDMPSRRSEAIADLEEYLSMHPRDVKAARTLSNLRRSGSSAEVGSGASEPSTLSDAGSASASGPSWNRVSYTAEHIGEGEIFAKHRICFKVPREHLSKLKGGSATVQVRGGSFALEADHESGTVETVIESPDPIPAADAIAERIHLRITSDTAPPGMEVCTVS